jgi:hypothetical protein
MVCLHVVSMIVIGVEGARQEEEEPSQHHVAHGMSLPHKPSQKSPGKNWARGFEIRHPETQARRVKAMDWNRHEKNTYWKMAQWFEVIGRVLRDPAISKENVYNMDETGVMLREGARR